MWGVGVIEKPQLHEHTCIHTHTHTHTHMHTHTQKHTYTHRDKYTHTHTLAATSAHWSLEDTRSTSPKFYSGPPPPTHTHTHTHADSRSLSHTHTRTYTDTPRAHKHAHGHPCFTSTLRQPLTGGEEAESSHGSHCAGPPSTAPCLVFGVCSAVSVCVLVCCVWSV